MLAFQGGGYDAVVRSQAGIAVWWVLALGCPGRRDHAGACPSRRALVAAGLLAALGVWSWIGVTSSESPERTLSEVARIATYLGVLLLGLMTLDRRRAPMVLLGVGQRDRACRLPRRAVPVAAAGCSRPTRPAQFLPIAQHRLNWPLNYWNGLAALCALGIPLALALAAGHRPVAVRALSAAALPVLALCIGLTISRGGIAAAALGVVGPARRRPGPAARRRHRSALGGVASAILVGGRGPARAGAQGPAGSAALCSRATSSPW